VQSHTLRHLIGIVSLFNPSISLLSVEYLPSRDYGHCDDITMTHQE